MTSHSHHGDINAVPCTQVLLSLSAYIDSEPAAIDANIIHNHLEICPPCLAEVQMLQLLKTVVARSCCPDPAPERVRTRVLAQITRIQVQIARSEPRGE